MTEFNFDEYVNHLEFLGYDLKKDEYKGETQYLAIHPVYGGIAIIEFMGGIKFHTEYDANEQTQNKDKIPDLLKAINDLNKKSWVSAYHLIDDGSIRKVAFYLGAYSKKSFDSFIQAWIWDTKIRMDHKDFSSFIPVE
jgi:hypothetical protein